MFPSPPRPVLLVYRAKFLPLSPTNPTRSLAASRPLPFLSRSPVSLFSLVLSSCRSRLRALTLTKTDAVSLSDAFSTPYRICASHLPSHLLLSFHVPPVTNEVVRWGADTYDTNQVSQLDDLLSRRGWRHNCGHVTVCWCAPTRSWSSLLCCNLYSTGHRTTLVKETLISKWLHGSIGEERS